MTVTTSTARVVHNGNGTTTQFAVPFRFLENAQVAVFLRDAAGIQTLWTENTQYTLAGADLAAGGTLTVNTSPTDYTPATGERLVVIRAVPITQETDYVENDPFPAETHERTVDKLTMVNQEQTERLDRTFTIPETDAYAGSFVLPGDVERANRFLAFDALGGPTVAVGTTPTTTPVSAFMESLLSSADASSVRTQIDAAALGTANVFTKTQTWKLGVDVASASALALGDGNIFTITGSNAITSIGTKGVGTLVLLRFAAALTLTHDNDNIELQTGANITTAAGDTVFAHEHASGKWRLTNYARADGTALVSSTGVVKQVVGSATLAGSTTNSTSFVDVTGGSFSITPSDAAHKVKVELTWQGIMQNIAAANGNLVCQVLRGATVISATAGLELGSPAGSGNVGARGPMAFTILDSPASVAPVTYRLQHRVTNGSGTGQTIHIQITLTEIG